MILIIILIILFVYSLSVDKYLSRNENSLINENFSASNITKKYKSEEQADYYFDIRPFQVINNDLELADNERDNYLYEERQRFNKRKRDIKAKKWKLDSTEYKMILKIAEDQDKKIAWHAARPFEL
jgi:hypothetical protein